MSRSAPARSARVAVCRQCSQLVDGEPLAQLLERAQHAEDAVGHVGQVLLEVPLDVGHVLVAELGHARADPARRTSRLISSCPVSRHRSPTNRSGSPPTVPATRLARRTVRVGRRRRPRRARRRDPGPSGTGSLPSTIAFGPSSAAAERRPGLGQARRVLDEPDRRHGGGQVQVGGERDRPGAHVGHDPHAERAAAAAAISAPPRSDRRTSTRRAAARGAGRDASRRWPRRAPKRCSP